MINLAIDIGNTRVKAGVFHEDKLIKIASVEPENLATYATHEGVKHASVSSVGPKSEEMIKRLKNAGCNVFEVNSLTLLPFQNLYQTPATLGMDRVCSIAGAQFHFPEQNCLVIDAGTCITYDAISAKGEYVGGAISPGLAMRLKALHTFTNKLPEIEPEWPVKLEGASTTQSILSGVCYGLIDEIKGKITRYSEQYPELKVILTGGDADFLGKQLKSNIFAIPSLVLQGLNQILIFNVKKGNWPD